MFVFDNYRLPVKNGMSCDCEIEIILRLCLYCKSFSPLHCIVKATRKKPLSRGFGSFLMEYLMKKTHRADEKRFLVFSFKENFCFVKGLFLASDGCRSVSCSSLSSRDVLSCGGYQLITSRANFQFLSHKIICFYLGSEQTLLHAVYKGYCESAPSCLRPVLRAS